jgi:CHAT domain-containing protein
MANFRIGLSTKSIDDAVLRLENLFTDLITHGRFDEAFTIASEFRRCVTILNARNDALRDVPDETALLRVLSETPSVHTVVKAKAMGRLADVAAGSGNTTDSRNLEEIAMDLFTQSGHAHGMLDVLFQQACRNLRGGEVDLDREMETIKTYLQNYESQDYLYGFHNSAVTLLNSVATLFSFDLQLEIAHLSEELATKGGAKLFWTLHYAGILAQWLTHSGRAPTVIEGARVLYEEIRGCDCQWLKGFVAQITTHAYLETGDRQNALKWSDLCKDSWQLCSPMEKAESFTIELRCTLGLHSDGDAIDKIVASADRKILDEIQDGLIMPAIDQMDWILSQVLIPKHDRRLISWLERVETLISRLVGIDADLKRANLYQFHANALLGEAKNRNDTTTEDEVVRLLDTAVPLYLKHKRLIEAANTRQIHGLVLFSIFEKSPTPEALNTALDMFQIAYEAFRDLDNPVQISSSSYWCAFLAYRGWCHRWIDAQYVLNALLLAESAKDQERIEMSILQGMEALVGKRNLGASQKVREIYNMALQICLIENNPRLLWEWLQKAKARSLSDLLGLGAQTSASLKSTIESHDVTKDLYDKEKELLIAIKNGDVKERLARRHELHSLQRKMQEFPALKAMMDLRDGSPVTLTELQNLLEETLSDNALPSNLSSQLVFVDWFYANSEVYVCTVKSQGLPMVRKCNISKSSIERWKRKYLDLDDGRNQSILSDDIDEHDPEYPLRQLDPLVEPLKDLLDKDAILILSVTDVLHSVPMHALWIDKAPMITRYPIVYCASMTIFVQCWRQAAAQRSERAKVAMMAVFEPSPGIGFSRNEQQRVYNEIHRIASTPDANIITGAAGNRANLQSALQSSTLFHFHGHCRLDKTMIADQSLVLADGDFSVRDFFEEKLLGLHITLIACDSASQSISAGDEPLGIVTALLCAGASSVLGTIWPTSSRTGRNFSTEFYGELKKGPGDGIFNLAMALQKAVVNIRKERTTRHPCHWASFVLHGSCFASMSSDK